LVFFFRKSDALTILAIPGNFIWFLTGVSRSLSISWSLNSLQQIRNWTM
jgi:hypothetical protein